MTIAQLIDLLRSYGVDILILGAADALLTALIGKIPEKILPKKYLTVIPFLLGFLLYALFFPLLKNLSAEDFSVVLERGFGVGLTAILCNLLFARLTGKKDGTSGAASLVKQLLKDCIKEPALTEAAEKIAEAFFGEIEGTDGDKTQADGTSETDDKSETDGTPETDDKSETDGTPETDDKSETDGAPETDDKSETDSTSETKNNEIDKISELLKTYAPQLTDGERKALTALIVAALKEWKTAETDDAEKNA